MSIQVDVVTPINADAASGYSKKDITHEKNEQNVSTKKVSRGYGASLFKHYQEQKGCDITFILEDKSKITAHKVVLSMASPVFAAMMRDPFEEEKTISQIRLPDVTREEMDTIMQCAYTEDCDFAVSQIPRLMKLSIRFQLPKLFAMCVFNLTNKMESNTIFEHMRHAESLPDAGSKCKSFLYDNLQSVVENPAFLNISKQSLTDVLSCDEINIDEGLLFSRILDWGKHQIKKRGGDPDDLPLVKTEVRDLLSLIRISSLNLKDITHHLIPSKLFGEDEMMALINYISLPSTSSHLPVITGFSFYKYLNSELSARTPSATVYHPLLYWDEASQLSVRHPTEFEGPRIHLSSDQRTVKLMRRITKADTVHYSRLKLGSQSGNGGEDSNQSPFLSGKEDLQGRLLNLSCEDEGVLVKSRFPLSQDGELVNCARDRLDFSMTINSLQRSDTKVVSEDLDGGEAPMNKPPWRKIIFGLCEESVCQTNFLISRALSRGLMMSATLDSISTFNVREFFPTSSTPAASLEKQTPTFPFKIDVAFAPNSSAAVFKLGDKSIHVKVPKTGKWHLFVYLYNVDDSVTISD